MGTFFTVVLVIVGIIAVAVIAGLVWLTKKARLAKGYLVYGGLALGLEALKQHAAKPENANDQEIAALVVRAEAAQVSGKAELDKGNVEQAVAVMVPVIEEMAKFKEALDKERAAQAAAQQQSAAGPVIDGEFTVVEPTLALPAPPADGGSADAAPAEGVPADAVPSTGVAPAADAPPAAPAASGGDHVGSTPDTVSGAPSYVTKR